MNLNFKLFTLLALFSLFGLSAMAQDVIVLKNGDEIKSLVQEVAPEHILYKKWENQAGPNYYLKKNEVLIIMYQNGTKDVFNEVTKPSEPKLQNPEHTHPKTLQLFQLILVKKPPNNPLFRSISTQKP